MMMMPSTLPSDATLPELLAARARRASDARLAIDVAAGVLVAAAAMFWRPHGWVALSGAALCFASFGGWGIADRAVRESVAPDAARLPRLLRGVAAVLGAGAGLAFVGGLVAIALGTIIS